MDTHCRYVLVRQMAEYQVPRILWETLESVLLAQGRAFVKDVAKRLEVNEKELLRQVMPSSKISVYLHDTHTEDMQCHAYVQTGSVTHHCRRPVTLGSEFCFLHVRDRLQVFEPSESSHVIQLAHSPDRPPLWKRPDGSVINAEGAVVGEYDTENNILTLFRTD